MVELGGARPCEEPVPGVGANPRNEGQPGRGHPEPDGAHQPREIREEVAHDVFCPAVDRCYEEHRGRSQPAKHGLRFLKPHR